MSPEFFSFMNLLGQRGGENGRFEASVGDCHIYFHVAPLIPIGGQVRLLLLGIP